MGAANHVEEIEFCGEDAPCTGIAWALKQSIGETAQELLPALRFSEFAASTLGQFALSRHSSPSGIGLIDR